MMVVGVVVMMVVVVLMMMVVVVGGCDGGVEMARIVTMTTNDDKMPVRTRASHLQLAARCLHLLSEHLWQRQRHATSSPLPQHEGLHLLAAPERRVSAPRLRWLKVLN